MKNVILKYLSFVAFALSFHSSWGSEQFEFGEIIVENNKAQRDLHDQIQRTSENGVVDLKVKFEKQVITANEERVVTIKTNKDILTFDKEKKQSRASSTQNEKRLALEFEALE